MWSKCIIDMEGERKEIRIMKIIESSHLANALKGQKLIAQGSALGMKVARKNAL